MYNTPTERSGNQVMFEQLVRVKIKEGTFFVISLRSDGKISIAQQVEMRSGEKLIHVFLKNAIEIEPNILFTIHEAVKQAVQTLFVVDEPSTEK